MVECQQNKIYDVTFLVLDAAASSKSVYVRQYESFSIITVKHFCLSVKVFVYLSLIVFFPFLAKEYVNNLENEHEFAL